MLKSIVDLNDKQTEYALSHQVLDAGSRFFGGVKDLMTGVPRPSHVGTASDLATMTASYLHPDSRYYRDAELLQAIGLAADFMLSRQHEDGTISLGSTNFHSPPDTGFVVSGMAQVYRVMTASGAEEIRPAAEKVRLFMERSIPAMLTGGCHTPNHRWVLTSALANLYAIFGREELAARAEEWLAEGLDCTEDGEWTERSNGIYNSVSDVMLYYTAVYLDKPDIMEHVRRNLRMMVYLVHPDGDIVTEYAGRQDYGRKLDLSPYVLSYGLMAAYDRDPLFAAMFDAAARACSELGPINNHAMLGMMAYPELQRLDIPRAELPSAYVKIINEGHPAAEELEKLPLAGHHERLEHSGMHKSFGSPVVRIRDRELSGTIMTRVPPFLSLRQGKASLLAAHVWSSFSPGFVEFDAFEAENGVYRLGKTMEKGYHGPLPQHILERVIESKTHTWYLLPHQHRPATHTQRHEIAADIVAGEREWIISIRSDDRMEDVFTQVMFTFDADCLMSGDGLQRTDGGQWLWTEGTLRCQAGPDWIEIDGGAHEHGLSVYRDVSPRPGAQTFIVNLLTPFEKVFKVRFGTQQKQADME